MKRWMMVEVPEEEAEQFKVKWAKEGYQVADTDQDVKQVIEEINYNFRCESTKHQIKEMVLQWFLETGIKPEKDFTIKFKTANMGKIGGFAVLGITLSDEKLEKKLKEEFGATDLEVEMESSRGGFDYEVINNEEEFEFSMGDYIDSLKLETPIEIKNGIGLNENELKKKISSTLNIELGEAHSYVIQNSDIVYPIRFIEKNGEDRILFILIEDKRGWIRYFSLSEFDAEEMNQIGNCTEIALKENALKKLFNKS